MSTPTPINLQNAGLFSLLAYAPTGIQDSIFWGLALGSLKPEFQAAIELKSMGWVDITQTIGNNLPTTPTLPHPENYYFDTRTNTSFHVFENSQTHQIVIAFRGSVSPLSSVTNWAADLTLSDQGATSYQGIQTGASAALLYLQKTPPYNQDQVLVDGHSLGGGIAQTFAVINSLNGFSQNTLPIARQSFTNFPDLGPDLTSYQSPSSVLAFQNTFLQGDPAAALFQEVGPTGLGSYADKNAPLWLVSNFATDEASQLARWSSTSSLANLLIATFAPGEAIASTLGLARDILGAHSLDNFNTAAQEQISASGIDQNPGTPDSTATQQGIDSAINIIVSIPFVAYELGKIEAQVNGVLGNATGERPANSFDVSRSTIGVAGGGYGIGYATGSIDRPSVVIGDANPDILVGGLQPTTIRAGSGTDFLVGGPGNATLYGGAGIDTFIFDIAGATTAATETIVNPAGSGTLGVATNTTYDVLAGGAPVANTPGTWMDSNGTKYVFTGDPGVSVGTLTITNGVLGSNPADSIVITDFNLSSAQTVNGFMGIVLPGNIALTAGATAGVDPPASFPAGSQGSYTLSLDAPSNTAQTITLQLSGANPSDFKATVGNNVMALNADGTFTVTLPAGASNVSFGLIDVTADTGTSDIAAGTTLQLTASIPNLANPGGPAIQGTPLSINYTPESSDTSTAPVPTNVITGQLIGGVTTYQGDGGNDSIIAGAGPNQILADNSGSDSIIGGSGANTVYGGSGNDVIALNGATDLLSIGNGFDTVSGSSGQDTMYGHGGSALISGNGGKDLILVRGGNNEIYAGAKTNLANAIAQAIAGTATHVQGDLLSVLDGNNTIVSGNGNDLVTAGAGHDVIVLGPGNDTFEGGQELTDGAANWSTTVTGTTLSPLLTLQNVNSTVEGYTNPFPQPYHGITDGAGNPAAGPANDTLFAGNGNDFIYLGNGNNFIEVGSGADSIFGGMGNDTITAGTGADLIAGGGGTTYIYGKRSRKHVFSRSRGMARNAVVISPC